MLVVKITNIVVVLILVLCNFLFRYIPGMEVTLSSRLKSLYSIYCKVLLLIYCKIYVLFVITCLNHHELKFKKEGVMDILQMALHSCSVDHADARRCTARAEPKKDRDS